MKENKDYTEEGWIGIADSTNPYTLMLRHDPHSYYNEKARKLAEIRRKIDK